MKVRLIKMGKPAFAASQDGVAEYAKRLTAFTPFESVVYKDAKPIRFFQDLTGPLRLLVLLDEKGASLSSVALAEKFRHWSDAQALKEVSLVIGDPYGFDEATRKLAGFTWSLSPLTFPSDIAWLVAAEQIYRAFTILKGMKYHHP